MIYKDIFEGSVSFANSNVREAELSTLRCSENRMVGREGGGKRRAYAVTLIEVEAGVR
jgi:hypothetical protein